MSARIITRTIAPVSLLALASLALAPASATGSGTWAQKGSTLVGSAANDLFGVALSIDADGDTIAIGASDNDDTFSNAGQVRVLGFADGAWSALGSAIDGAASEDYFGSALSLSDDGTRVAVGAPFYGAGDTGRVRVFESSGGSWTLMGSAIDGEDAGERAGGSVAISGDGSTVVIGAAFNDDAGTDRGEVRVYRWNSGTTTWDRRGSLDIAGERDQDRLGYSVAINENGTIIAAGARDNDGAAGSSSNAGHARAYYFNTGTNQWAQRGGDIDAEAAGDRLGTAVSLDSAGDVLAIGAPNNDIGATATDAGHTVVYAWDADSTDWVQRGTDIDGAAGDDSGTSVSVSADGTSVLVGSPGNNSDAGSANLYAWDGAAWTVSAPTRVGTAGDAAGTAVSLSSDGNTVVVGLPENDTTASNAGAVVVFGYTLTVTESAVAGTPGIYLHVAGPVGRSAQGSPVYFGSDRVAHTSTYMLSITSPTGVVTRVLASGTVDARGNLEAMVRLPHLAPGQYDVVMSGKHLGGHGLWLSARLRVDDSGRIAELGDNRPAMN